MQKRIQIKMELFELMVSYIRDHYDTDDRERYHRITDGVEEKQEALAKHNAYTVYKTGQDKETREAARQIYLEKTGMLPDFRW